MIENPSPPDGYESWLDFAIMWLSRRLSLSTWSVQPWQQHAAARRELDDLRAKAAIVDKLDKTRDGVPIVQGMRLFYVHPKNGKVFDWPLLNGCIHCYKTSHYSEDHKLVWIGACDCYSTREAAAKPKHAEKREVGDGTARQEEESQRLRADREALIRLWRNPSRTQWGYHPQSDRMGYYLDGKWAGVTIEDVIAAEAAAGSESEQ